MLIEVTEEELQMIQKFRTNSSRKTWLDYTQIHCKHNWVRDTENMTKICTMCNLGKLIW